MRYLGTPALSKLWQNRTPLEQYLSNEVVGTRMRRWHRPLHDMANVYARGVVKRTTGQILVPEDVQRRRDLNTLSDVMQYLRELNGRAGLPVLANNKKPAHARAMIAIYTSLELRSINPPEPLNSLGCRATTDRSQDRRYMLFPIES